MRSRPIGWHGLGVLAWLYATTREQLVIVGLDSVALDYSLRFFVFRIASCKR